MMSRSDEKYRSYSFKHFPGLFVAVVLVISSGSGSVRAQGSASSWEAPDAAKKVENPAKVTPAGLKKAAQLYTDNCVICHGKGGAGDGVVGSSLTPKPANFTDDKLMNKLTDGELFWKMTTGRGPMPAWKDQIPEPQRWQLVNYLRTFTHKTAAAK